MVGTRTSERNRRRDLSVHARHKDGGIQVYERFLAKRSRMGAKLSAREASEHALAEIRLERALDRALDSLYCEAGI